jgi:hypothetical protein
MHIKFWADNPKGRDHSEDLAVDERIILELILEKQDGEFGLDLYASG